MKRFAVFLFAIAACSGPLANHEHDGLYVSESMFLGMEVAWVVYGDKFDLFMNGAVTTHSCKQGRDRIEVDTGQTFVVSTTETGKEVVISYQKLRTREIKYRMVRVSEKTEFTIQEIRDFISQVRSKN